MSEPSQPENGSAGDGEATRQVILLKRGHRWVFRYSTGDELRVMNELAAMAEDPTSPLDWFDAAMLSHQMGQLLGHQFEYLMKP